MTGEISNFTRAASGHCYFNLKDAQAQGYAEAEPSLDIDGYDAQHKTGILASLAGPLAGASISIFAVSTYDTDYLLVQERDLDRASDALSRAGHTVAPLPA